LTTTPILDPLLGITTGVVIDFDMPGLAALGGHWRFRARIDFETSQIDLYLFDSTNPTVEYPLTTEQQLEIAQLGATFSTAFQLGYKLHYAGGRVSRIGISIAIVNNQPVLQQELRLETMAGTTVDYRVDMPMPYARYTLTDTWKAKVLVKDGNGAYLDMLLGADGLGLPWKVLSGYFERLAAFHQDGKRAGATFTPATISAANPDPHHGFTLQVPDANKLLPSAGAIARFHGCEFNPSEPGSTQTHIWIRQAEFVQGDVVGAVDEYGASSYASFDSFSEIYAAVNAIGGMLHEAGGVRARTASIATRGVSIHGIRVDADGGRMVRLVFSASLGVSRGLSGTLVDATTGSVLTGTDAADLTVVLGDQPSAADFAADPNARPAHPGLLELRRSYWHETGNVGWRYRDETGAYGSGTMMSYATSMGHVMAALDAAAAGALIAVPVSAGIVDPDNVGLRLTGGFEGQQPVVAIRRFVVDPSKPVPVAADVNYFINEPGDVRASTVYYYDTPGVAGGVSQQALASAIQAGTAGDGDMFAPIIKALNALQVPGLLVKIMAIGTLQVNEYKSFSAKVTFRIGGADVERAMAFKFARDDEGTWHVGEIKWGVNIATNRIDWPGIYHGILPEGDYVDPESWSRRMNRNHEETLVGLFQVEDGSWQWLQFLCGAFDATSGFDVLPSIGSAGDYHQGLYGWLEAIGPIIDGVRTRIPVTDPRHPYMLAANLRDETISMAEYEDGLMRVLGWMFQFMAVCPSQPGGYYTAPNWPGIEPDSSRPGIPWYPSQDPSWAHVYG
jgi:hypothetical protein